jgi:anti-anti-sigma regulatory factor
MIDDAESDRRLDDRERQLWAKLGILSAVVCPMTAREQVIGCILAGKRIRHGFGDADARLYLAVARHAATIIDQKQLENEQERLNREIIGTHERLIRDLSAPLIPITQGILVLPLIGSIDSVRAQQVMESMLQGVESHDAEVVIIDITGVPVLDTSVANHLIQMTSAAALLGARSVLVGIMPSVAQTLVELGVDLSSITTRNNLQGGVEYALRLQGLHITPLHK